jgi:hypothetical protein
MEIDGFNAVPFPDLREELYQFLKPLDALIGCQRERRPDQAHIHAIDIFRSRVIPVSA